jgi:serine protease Do
MSFRTKTASVVTYLILLAAAATMRPGPAVGYTLPSAAADGSKVENTETLQRLSKGIASIARSANQAIVFVSVYKTAEGLPRGMVDPFDFFFGPGRRYPNEQDRAPRREGGLGSGFFVDLDKGYIITNNHVVQGADEIQLKLANGQSYEGKIVGRDANTDIAVVQVKDNKFNRSGLGALPIGDSEKVEVGDFVVALGAPFGLEASLSFGVVSAMGRGNLDITKLGNFIQTDAAINPGNSGGPLLDVSGQVIGVNTAIYSRSGAYNGIGFAVPSNLAKSVAEQLISSGYIRRGYLGVYLQPIDEDIRGGLNIPADVKGGALVARVAGGGPADKAGIEPGDVVTSVNGSDMKGSSEIVNTIGLMKPGTSVDLAVWREGKKRNVKLTIGQHPDDESGGAKTAQVEKDKELQFGMTIASWSKDLQSRYNFESKAGAVVTQVERDGAAERSGLRPGDIILKADGKKVDNAETFKKLTRGKTKVLVWIERATEYYFVQLREK